MAETVLAVDLGKTGCRAALWVGEARVDGEAAGAPGLATPGGVIAAERAVLAVACPLLRAAGVTRVERACVGAAGAEATPDGSQDLAGRLAAGLPAAEVAVTSDAVTSHAGALADGDGVILAIGTGTVALARSGMRLSRADGWGPWLGDEGSGTWIGLCGLRAALRAHDERGPETALRAAAGRMFGPLAGIARVVNDAATAARFAPEVARAASLGDAMARAILERAAGHLARAATGAASLVGLGPGAPCAVVGGLTRLDPLLMERLDELLQDAGLSLVSPLGTSVDGAHLLARRNDLPHEAHIVRHRLELQAGAPD
ncbi:MAG: N-acetylglucosamine kinase [Acetobacteraceae bacterium]